MPQTKMITFPDGKDYILASISADEGLNLLGKLQVAKADENAGVNRLTPIVEFIQRSLSRTYRGMTIEQTWTALGIPDKNNLFACVCAAPGIFLIAAEIFQLSNGPEVTKRMGELLGRPNA